MEQLARSRDGRPREAPGKVRREATEHDRLRIKKHADSYIMYRQIYLDEGAPAE